MKRRDFLDVWLKLAGTSLGALILYPVARYLVPPKIPEATSRRVVAAKKDELAPGSFKIFPFGSQPGILVRTRDGDYRALAAVCTHLACTVQYRDDLHGVWCACHNGRYDLDGQVLSGPPPRALERYVVHVEGDDIVVEKATSA
jgi:Rieske Fe-S protein